MSINTSRRIDLARQDAISDEAKQFASAAKTEEIAEIGINLSVQEAQSIVNFYHQVKKQKAPPRYIQGKSKHGINRVRYSVTPVKITETGSTALLIHGDRISEGGGSKIKNGIVSINCNGTWIHLDLVMKKLKKNKTRNLLHAEQVKQQLDYSHPFSKFFEKPAVCTANLGDNRQCIVLPFACGDLFSAEFDSFHDLYMPIIHTTKALYFIHSQGFIHRDVKPDNIFEFDDDFVLGDCDSLVQENSQFLLSGTAIYLPPECWEGAPQNRSGDMYALGVTILHQITHHLMHTLSDDELYERAEKLNPHYSVLENETKGHDLIIHKLKHTLAALKNKTFKLAPDESQAAIKLALFAVKLTEKNPQYRPTAEQMLNLIDPDWSDRDSHPSSDESSVEEYSE